MRTIDQLLYSSMTAYALAYIAQIDGVDTMTRKELIDNINQLYGFDDIIGGAEGSGTGTLRMELAYQIDLDWHPEPALWYEISYWRNKQDRIDANEDAEYGAEWGMYGEAAECKNVSQPNKNNWFGDNWRIIRVQRDAPGEYFVTYRRYPLLDADRIEDQS